MQSFGHNRVAGLCSNRHLAAAVLHPRRDGNERVAERGHQAPLAGDADQADIREYAEHHHPGGSECGRRILDHEARFHHARPSGTRYSRAPRTLCRYADAGEEARDARADDGGDYPRQLRAHARLLHLPAERHHAGDGYGVEREVRRKREYLSLRSYGAALVCERGGDGRVLLHAGCPQLFPRASGGRIRVSDLRGRRACRSASGFHKAECDPRFHLGCRRRQRRLFHHGER